MRTAMLTINMYVVIAPSPQHIFRVTQYSNKCDSSNNTHAETKFIMMIVIANAVYCFIYSNVQSCTI